MIKIQKELSTLASENITSHQIKFIYNLKNKFIICEWDENVINNQIRDSAKEVDLKIKDAYLALYWLLINKNKGPKIAAIISELQRNDIIKIFETVF